MCDFQDWVIGLPAQYIILFTYTGGSQQLCCEDTQDTLQRVLYGKEVRTLNSSQHQLGTHENEPPWKCIILSWSNLQMTVALNDI